MPVTQFLNQDSCPMLFKYHKTDTKCNDELQWRLWNENNTKYDGVFMCILWQGHSDPIPMFVPVTLLDAILWNVMCDIEQVTKHTASTTKIQLINMIRVDFARCMCQILDPLQDCYGYWSYLALSLLLLCIVVIFMSLIHFPNKISFWLKHFSSLIFTSHCQVYPEYPVHFINNIHYV